VEVVVRGDSVRSATVVATGEPVPANLLQAYRTVDGLFALLQDAYERNAVTVVVEYDDALKFPRTAYVDYSRSAIDEEFGWTIQTLWPQR
jgi:hypothetical protein